MSFSNTTMRVPVKAAVTPHLALIGGYWRVSPQPKRARPEVRQLWQQAHNIKDLLNAGRCHLSKR